jgi:hypothetical protein
MWDTFACATANLLTYFIISIAVLENVPPDTGLQKRATFSTLKVGLAGTGNRTRATYVASSGTNRSAILYAFIFRYKYYICLVYMCISDGLMHYRFREHGSPSLLLNPQPPLFRVLDPNPYSDPSNPPPRDTDARKLACSVLHKNLETLHC